MYVHTYTYMLVCSQSGRSDSRYKIHIVNTLNLIIKLLMSKLINIQVKMYDISTHRELAYYMHICYVIEYI